MQYKYAKELPDTSDLASGRVFYSFPGYPAFPVRLASEIFQRCAASRKAYYNDTNPCTLYDPCCGAAYHLSVLGYLHGELIREIIASDIDVKAVDLATRNLGLLSVAGMERRIDEITYMLGQYSKESHREALASARRLKSKIIAQERPLDTRVFQANATDRQGIRHNIHTQSVDMVLTDIPYGVHSRWLGSDDSSNPIESMLDALFDILSPSGIVAIASDKKQKVFPEKYQRVEQFQVGKRRVVILRPVRQSHIHPETTGG